MPRLATVDPIASDIAWSSRASAADALQRVGHGDAFCAIWLKEGKWQWSKANTDFQTLSQMAMILQEFAQACVREVLKGE